MGSPLFDEWFKEEREEAAEKATIVTLQKSITDLLIEKFDFIPKAVKESILSIDDIDSLNELLRKVLKVSDIEEFKVLVDKAEKNE